LDELKRAHSYHQRQLEENIQKIQHKEESIELLKKANEKHAEILGEISKALGILKKDIAATMPIGKDCTNSITEVD
jgi:hypothetical protein